MLRRSCRRPTVPRTHVLLCTFNRWERLPPLRRHPHAALITAIIGLCFGRGGFLIAAWNARETWTKKWEDAARGRVDTAALMHEKYAAGPQSALVLLETFSEQHGGDARQLWEALPLHALGLGRAG